MSTDTAGAIAAPAGPGSVEPARRGRLVMSRQVVEKVASQATSEAVSTSGRSRGLLGFGERPDSGAKPKVDADLSTDSADLAIAVGLTYPGLDPDSHAADP